MINNKGRQEYGIFLNNDQLKKDAREAKLLITGIGDKGIAESAKLENSYKRLTGTLATLGGGMALGALAKELYSFANTFDKSMKEVSTLSNTVSADLDGFKQSILDMTTQIPVGADQAAKALYQIVSAGHDGAEGMYVLEVAAKAAVGGVTETVTAADAITTLLNAYKKDASEAMDISDQLFTTVRLGKTTFGELGHHIAQVAPIAASFGIEMDQVLAAVATLTKSGTPTAQAMTQIRSAIVESTKVLGDGYFVTHTFQEGLNEISRRANGSEAEMRRLIPSIEAMTGVLGLTGINAQMAASDLKELNNSLGATEEATAKMTTQASAQMTMLKNNMLKKFHDIGAGAVDMVGSVAKFLNSDGIFNKTALDDLIATMGVLIVTVGAYKAQLILTNTLDGARQNLRYTAEIAELQNLIGVKEADKNQDLQKLVLDGKLSQSQAAKIALLRVEANEKLKAMQTEAASAALELKNAFADIDNNTKRIAALDANIIKKEASLDVAIRSGNQKKINAITTKIDSLETDRNTLATANNTTQGKLNGLQSKASATATTAETFQQRLNTTSTLAGAKAKGIMTLATRGLTNAFKGLTVAMRKNPIGLVISLVTMAISAFIAFAEKVEDATDITSQFSSQLTVENAQIDILFQRLKNAKKGTEEYAGVKNEITSKYGQYLKGLSDEITSLENIKEAYNAIKKSARESIIERLRTEKLHEASIKAQEGYEGAYDKIYSGLQDSFPDENKHLVDAYMPMIRDILEAENKTLLSDEEAVRNGVVTALREAIKGGRLHKIQGAQSIFNRINGGLQEWLQTSKEWDSKQKEIDTKLALIPKSSNISTEDATILHTSNNNSTDKTKTKQDKIRETKDLEFAVRQAKLDTEKETLEKVLAQNKLNYDIEIEQIERQRADKLAKIQDAEREEWKAKNPDWKEDKLTPKHTTTQLSAEDSKPYNELTTYAEAQFEISKKGAYKTALNEYAEFANSYIDKVREFEENLKTLGEKHKHDRAALVNSGASEDEIKKFDERAKQEVAAVTNVQKTLLEGLDEQMEMKSQTFLAFVEGIADMGIEELKLKLDEAEQLLADAQIATEGTDDQSSVIEYQAQIKMLKQQIVALGKNSDKKETKESGDPLNKYKAALKTVNELGGAAKDIAQAFAGLDGDIFEVMDSIGSMTSSVGSMLSTILLMDATSKLTIVGTTAAASVGVVTVSTAAATAIKGVEKASVILAIIGAALQIITAIAKIFTEAFTGDKKKEKEIKSLQGEVDTLGESYNKLEKAIDKAYSADASKLIAQQDEALSKQNELLEEQKRLEESKKDPDTEAIDNYNDKLEENNEKLEENKEKAIEAIIGTDVKSAIDEFANAYIDAWAAGEDKAASMKDVVRKMVKSAVTELMKSRLSPEVTDFMNFLAKAMEDGILTSAEEQALDEWEKRIYAKAKGIDENFGKYIKEDGTDDRESSAKGIATASQESVDENNGRLTAIQGMMFELNESARQQLELSMANLPQLQHLSSMNNHLSVISENTAYCRHLEAIDKNMLTMQKTLAEIQHHGINVK